MSESYTPGQFFHATVLPSEALDGTGFNGSDAVDHSFFPLTSGSQSDALLELNRLLEGKPVDGSVVILTNVMANCTWVFTAEVHVQRTVVFV